MEKIKEYVEKSALALEQIETILRKKGLNEENSAQLFNRINLMNLYLTRERQALENL